MKKTVTESIFDGKTTVIPMAEVSHVNKDTRENFKGAISIVFSHSKWNDETQMMEPNVYMMPDEAARFMSAWTMYRHELEIETLSDAHHSNSPR